MKNETKEKRATFTPGPWTSEDCTPGGNKGLCFAVKSEHTIIAKTTDGWREAKANARLIAAAPELYEQCKLFERAIVELMMQGETGGYEELEKVREVLAQVDGGEG
tara:strand:+ start:148 stop:465 length:318 start_codon:yes stop_codon:yes gene_type:complete